MSPAKALSPQATWSAPPDGIFKFNSDADFSSDTNTAAMAILVRDNRGLLCEGYWFIRPASLALMGEATALLDNVAFLRDRGLHAVIFESDSNQLVDEINQEDKGVHRKYKL